MYFDYPAKRIATAAAIALLLPLLAGCGDGALSLSGPSAMPTAPTLKVTAEKTGSPITVSKLAQ